MRTKIVAECIKAGADPRQTGVVTVQISGRGAGVFLLARAERAISAALAALSSDEAAVRHVRTENSTRAKGLKP